MTSIDNQPLVTDVDSLVAEHGSTRYAEFVRAPSLSLGLFAVGAGHEDTQSPHREDEVYVVVAGRATLVVDGDRTEVSAGSVAYVPAGVPHRFEDVTQDLRVYVVFAPPEYSG
jgi:mannose-6-phosphate isomerase-like protein (cupin superfamily)